MSISIGLSVSSSIVTISKSLPLGSSFSRIGPQSEAAAPVTVCRPPRMWRRKSASLNEPCVCPMPVYQTRPPSKFEHHEIGWSSATAESSCSSYVASSTVARTWTSLARGL